MKETIWINLDPERIDLSTLERRFAGKYRLIARAIPGNAPELVLEQAKQADVVISILEKWDEEALKKVRGKVRMLQKYGMGLDNIDCAAAARCGIPVANVIGANSAAVAEVALMHILNISRHFTSAVSSVKSGRWQFTTGSELDGKTVGLLGLGHIAHHLVRMLSGFRMEVLAYDPFVTQAPEGVTLVDSREELFRRSHIVSLHITLYGGDAGEHRPHLLCPDAARRGAGEHLPRRCGERRGPGAGAAQRPSVGGRTGCAGPGAAPAGQPAGTDGQRVHHPPYRGGDLRGGTALPGDHGGQHRDVSGARRALLPGAEPGRFLR